MRVLALAAAVVSAAAVLEQLPTVHGAHMAATTTCPLYVQSSVSSTLTKPIKEVVKKPTTKKKSDSSSDSSSDNDTDVGSKDKTPSSTRVNSTGGSGDGGNDAGTGSTTPKPTTKAPTGSTTPTPTTKAPTDSTTTPAPTTDVPATTTAPPKATDGSGGSGGAGVTTAGRTPSATTKAPTTRQLQADADDAGDTTPAPSATTKAPTDTTATTPTPTPTTKAPAGSTSKTPTPTATSSNVNTSDNATSPSAADGLTNSSSSSNSSSLTAVDAFTCDETFYNQWTTLGITCGSKQLDVAAAVAASSCMIYSGAVGKITGSTCVSICSFPACTDNAWVYDGSTNGLASAVYSSYTLDAFMPAAMKARLTERSSTSSVFLSNATMAATQQCAYASEGSFASCSCSALLVYGTSDEETKIERAIEQAQGVIPKDDTTLAGNVLGPTSKSIAGVTVVMSTIAAVAGGVVSGAGAAGASAAAVGANVAVVTVEICQFAVFLNQLDLEGKSAALALFGKQMAPSAFTFLPFGKLANGSDLDDDSDDSTTRRRRLQAAAAFGKYATPYDQHRRLADNSDDLTAPDSGIAKYSRTLGIKEDMLFLVTLAGVIVVMGGVLALFVLAYAIAGLFMDRSEFMVKFFDKMIGLQLLIVILSQYTIGVTGTYQIYHSVEQGKATEPKCILAAVSLLVLAIGIILYGFYVVRKHEDDLKDVGTVAHMKKAVNMRYGPLYDEYKFKNRFFFAPKMLLALVTGCATGYVGTKATYQVSVILACHVLFFFYLEIKSPHHSRFVQTTTSFVTIMKIAVLVLTFFLISASAADGFPSELQNGISLAIVGLNLFVLFLLMIRSLYTFWKKYQLQRDAKFDEDDERTAQDYFKDDTPQQKDRVAAQDAARSSANRQPTPQTYQQTQTQQQQRSPYINHPATEYGASADDEKFSDEIRLRSGTHMQESARSSYDSRPYDENRRTATNHYMADERAGHGQRRNDVIEL